jgi:hypothetical protein
MSFFARSRGVSSDESTGAEFNIGIGAGWVLVPTGDGALSELPVLAAKAQSAVEVPANPARKQSR